MRKTYITASVVAITIVLWIGSGFLKKESPALPQSVALKNLALQAQNEDRPLTQVRVSTSYASEQDRSIRVRGQTQPERTVEIQAQISGLVQARPANRGDQVRAGDLLCEITVEDRNANLKEAAAVLSQAELEYQGVMKLLDKGLQSDAGIAAAEARVAAAQAVVQRRLLEKSKLKIKAPFPGVIEEVHMEIGQFVTPGSVCATLVDLDPMLLVGEVSEQARLLIERTQEALERGIRAVKPGRPFNVVGRAIESYAKRFDYGVVRDFTGHGVGAEFHSGLIIPHYDTAPANAMPMEEGMVFTIEPMLTIGTVLWDMWADGWTVTTKDKALSAQFEHTLAVTASGADVLTLP